MNYEAQNFRIYSVLNTWEPPRLLISKEDKRHFHCHFGLPLPPQVVVFAVGNWSGYHANARIAVDVYLDETIPPQRVGFISKDQTAMCWDGFWEEPFILKSMELYEQDRMAKLSLTVEVAESGKSRMKDTPKPVSKETPRVTCKDTPRSSRWTPKAITPMIKKSQTNEALAMFIDDNESKNSSPNSLRSTRKSRQRSLEECSTPKRRSIIPNDNPVSNQCSPKPSSLSSPGKLPTPPDTPGRTTKVEGQVPSGRWGHAMCSIGENRLALIGGQGAKYQMSKDSLWTLDLDTLHWTEQERKESQDADRRLGHTAVYDAEKNMIFVYGGSKNKRWFSDVHILDVKSWTWTAVKAVGKAPARSYHSCTLFRGELFVYGGVFPNPDPQPDGCSNDLYIFKPETQSWYQPIVTGEKPKARSGHSATLLGEQLVFFGGWDAPVCNNDLVILDLAVMEYTSPTVTGKVPPARTWHASTSLPNNRVLIHGGFDGGHMLGDCHIFCLDTFAWTCVQPSVNLTARAGHIAFYRQDSNENKENNNNGVVFIFGGGNNKDHYYNDLVSLPLS